MTRDEAEKVAHCTHPADQVKVCRRTLSNGVKVAVRQCQVCGHNAGNVTKNPMTNHILPQWDQTLAARSREAWSVLNDYRQQEWQAQRDAESDDFWRRHEAAVNSQHWRRLREKVRGRCGGICEGCGERPGRHLHHLNYDRLGREMLFDVVYVCVECHSEIHGKDLRGKPAFFLKGVQTND